MLLQSVRSGSLATATTDNYKHKRRESSHAIHRRIESEVEQEGMSKGSGIFGKASFCPFCGVNTLERDRYAEKPPMPRYKNEFLCQTCGKGFALTPSLRWQEAGRLHKEHRQVRPPDELPKKKERCSADIELLTLQKYADRVGLSGTIERCKTGRFVWRNTDGQAHGSTDYNRMKIFLRGYQIAQMEADDQILATIEIMVNDF